MCHHWKQRALLGLCVLATLATHTTVQAQTTGASRLSGWVYVDRNNDGQLAFANDPLPEFVIPGVQIKLYRVDNSQETEISSVLTDANGHYNFTGLLSGTYSLRQVQPFEYIDGIDTVGLLSPTLGQSLPASAYAGNVAADAFTGIVLPDNVAGRMYNFGERGLAPGYVSKRFLLTSALPPPVALPEPSGMTLLLATALSWVPGRRWCRRYFAASS